MRRWIVSLMLATPLCLAGEPRAAPARLLDLEFQRADLHHVLRVLAEAGRVNVVVADDVQGQVTLRLRNVTWRQALQVVLRAHGLGAEQSGNIVRVAPLETLAKEAEVRARLREGRQAEAPLVTTVIPVSYARAEDLLPHVKAMLSPRGTASVDARTNVIIVRDAEPAAPR